MNGHKGGAPPLDREPRVSTAYLGQGQRSLLLQLGLPAVSRAVVSAHPECCQRRGSSPGALLHHGVRAQMCRLNGSGSCENHAFESDAVRNLKKKQYCTVKTENRRENKLNTEYQMEDKEGSSIESGQETVKFQKDMGN